MIENCPRDYAFWRDAFRWRQRGGPFTLSELQSIAQIVDDRSVYFDWSDEVRGVREALNPTGSISRKKQVVRQYAALLANLAAKQLGLAARNGEPIGIDRDTQVNLPGVTSIPGLITRTDRTLGSGRGDLRPLNRALAAINAGEGIGPTCRDEDERYER